MTVIEKKKEEFITEIEELYEQHLEDVQAEA